MVISVSSFTARVPRNLEWADQARGPANASIAFLQRLRRLFSPAAKERHSSRKTKKPAHAVLRCAAGLKAAGRSLPGPRIAIEAAMGAARATNGDYHGYHRHLHRF
jgi:hypothetical protein